MEHRIAIEPSLTPIKDYLTDKGFHVESMSIDRNAAKHGIDYDAIIVTGMNTNLAGINDTETKALVIDAAGLTPEEVYRQLQSRLV